MHRWLHRWVDVRHCLKLVIFSLSDNGSNMNQLVLNRNGGYEKKTDSFVAGVRGSIMWRKASAAVLLAVAVSYFCNSRPELSEQILQYIGLPNFQTSSQDPNSLEQAISSAWEALITLPTRQWTKVAVG